MTSLENAVARSSGLRPRTKELYLQHIRAFLNFVGKHTAFVAEDVMAWRKDMRRRKVSPQSVNIALNALRYAAENAKLGKLADCVREHRLRISTSKIGDKPERARALTWTEGRALIGTCDGTRGRDLRDNALITLGLRTGMLRFSMCQLTFNDVNPLQLTFIKKGGEKHVIQLDDVTRDALEKWVGWLRAHHIDGGRIFRSLGRQRVSVDNDASISDQLTPDGLYRALRERARQAGLKDLHPHVFRQTFLTWAKEVGAQPGQIAAVTGHKSDGVVSHDGVAGAATTPPANMLLPPWTAKELV